MPRYKLIACEILFREISYCASRSRNIIDIVFMPKGLHDMGEKKMSTRLQEVIDQVDVEQYEAILLGYGLCNNGIQGLRSSLPMVAPRAHDCITLLLGSKEKYAEYFGNNPGTYFHSPGWIERNTDLGSSQDSIMTQLGISRTYQEYVEKYGEDNAQFLMDSLGDWLKNYTKLVYIDDVQVGDFQEYKTQTQNEAKERGWEYEVLSGNTNLLLCLLNGEWNAQDFLITPPNRTIRPTYDDQIIGLDEEREDA